jgi:HK97 family phage major capsid protein
VIGLFRFFVVNGANMTDEQDTIEQTTPLPSPAIKAVGDWELDVNAIPFSKDVDGQWFDPDTDVMPDQFQTPAIIYQHSISDGAKGIEPRPVVIGKAVAGSLTRQADGWHIRVILDKANALAKRVMDAAKRGMVAVSSGTIDHLARLDIGGKLIPYDKAQPGRIAVWPFGELSLWDMGGGNLRPANHQAYALPAMKALYDDAGLTFPVSPEGDNSPANDGRAAGQAATRSDAAANKSKKGVIQMDEKEINTAVQAAVKAALEQKAAEDATKKAEQERVAAEVAKQVTEKVDAYKAEAAKSRRLPEGAPYQAQFSETWKYDNVEPADLALAIDVLRSRNAPVSPAAVKACALKLSEMKDDNTEKGRDGLSYVRHAFKAATGYQPTVEAIKATTDPMLTTGTTDGGNWVYALYSNELWASIRADNNIVSKIPSEVIPDGYSSKYYPIEGTDPTWYHVAEVTQSANPAPDATITASQITTPTKIQMTVNKMGARALYSGELLEDSIIPFAANLRRQLQVSGAEMLEHVVIDGDTSADVTNINDTNNSGGGAAGTEIFTLFDGLRHLALITNSGNSRAGGALSEDDYLETMWLMGTAGLAGADLAKCAFIIDPNVYKKSLQLSIVKTQDVWKNATVESGVLKNIWGYDIFPSWNMHRNSTVRKCTSTGEIDIDTTANNAYGAILGVRWDQWVLGYKRRMTIETTRFANSDSWEIVALARVGLVYRDTEAASITYGLTV